MTIITDIGRPLAARNFWLGVIAYLLPSFPIAFFWHLVWFEPAYHALQIYRADPVIPFGLASMMIQAVVFSWAFPRIFPAPRRSVVSDGLRYGAAIGLLSWSFTTLAVAAKHPMTSTSDFFILETAFTVVQFV